MADFKAFVIPDSITEFGESTPTTRVTEGNYLLELDSIVAGQIRDSGEGFMSFRTRIVDGPIGLPPEGHGLPIWNMGQFNEKQAWSAGRILHAVGFDVNTLKGVKVPDYAFFQKLTAGISAACKGRKFGATLTDYTGKSPYTSQIQGTFSAAEFEAQKTAAGNVVAQAPITAPATNGTTTAQPAAPTAPATVTDEELQTDLAALLQQGSPTV